MHAFKDGAGKDWEVVIDFYTIEKVKAHTGIDLLDLKRINEICADLPVFVHVIYRLCSDQTEGKISEREFFKIVTSDVIFNAIKAFRDEMVFFCPMEQKEVLRQIFDVSQTISDKATRILKDIAKEEMEKLPNLDTDHLAAVIVKEWLQETLSEKSGNLPANLASTLAV